MCWGEYSTHWCVCDSELLRLRCIAEVSNPSFCVVCPLSVVYWTWAHGVRLFHWSSNDSIHPHTPASLKLPWSSPGAWPQPCPRNSSPCGWALGWLSASATSTIKFPSWKRKRCHFWQWSPYVLILEQPFSHFDTHIVAQSCPCKTGTNTHALSTTLGSRDREMTAISKVYSASQCLSPQRITVTLKNLQSRNRRSVSILGCFAVHHSFKTLWLNMHIMLLFFCISGFFSLGECSVNLQALEPVGIQIYCLW